MLARCFSIVTAVGFLIVSGPLPAAAASPTPAATSSPDARPRDGGVVEGKIAAVDFQRSIITVDQPGRGKVDVTVLPSTSIQGKDAGYHSIADLKTGAQVEIYTSQTGDKYIAQIIKLK